MGRNYVVISADMHCGADLYDYKPYLEKKYHDEFETWASNYTDPWGAIDRENDDHRVGVASFASDVNWKSEKRQAQVEAEGIVAEVLFPNTTPPFFPSGAITAAAPADPPRNRHDYELRFAGVRAHNRWVADFCRALPGRRAGLAQVFLSDIDDTLTEVRRAHDDGLTGVLLPPDHSESVQKYYHPKWDALWGLCVELNMPIGTHGLVSGETSSVEAGKAATAIGILESWYYCQRPLNVMLMSGTFERFPQLKFVITELGAIWTRSVLEQLDGFVDQAHHKGTIANIFGAEAAAGLSKKPSEYFAHNCYLGTFLSDADIAERHSIGMDRIMWGADYPHHEGTSPLTKRAMRHNFAGMPEHEVRQLLGENAAECYGFDLDSLQEVADRIGPTVDELNFPLDASEFPKYPEETICPTFAEDPYKTTRT